MYDPIIEVVKVASAPIFDAHAVGVEGSANSPMETKAKPEPVVASAEKAFKTPSKVSSSLPLLFMT